MAQISMLCIDDDLITPYLNLIRKIGNPSSTSKPHITIRYFDDLIHVLEAHREFRVSSIKTTRLGMYITNNKNRLTYIVYLLCESDELESIEYKPDYPASKFHITLYEGEDYEYTTKLLDILNNFNWAYNIQLPENTKLLIKTLSSKKKSQGNSVIKYDSKITRVFNQIYYKLFSEARTLDYNLLVNMEDTQKLIIIEEVANELTKSAEKNSYHFEQKIDVKDILIEAQNEFSRVGMSKVQAHITPPELADNIFQYSKRYINFKRIKFGDPALGNGIFFNSLKNTYGIESLTDAIGVEINHELADKAKRRFESYGSTVLVEDFLNFEATAKRNLIVANPPYLRNQDMDREQKIKWADQIYKDLNINIDKRSGQYVYFMLHSHNWMENDCIAIWLIPSEILYTRYGKILRDYLLDRVELLSIHRFSPKDSKFENVSATSMVIVFKNCTPKPSMSFEYSVGEDINKPLYVRRISTSLIRNLSRWDRILNLDEVSKTNSTMKESNYRIGHFFTTKRGIATGNNSYFVLDKQKADELNIPIEFRVPILPKSRQLLSNVIESYENGFPILENVLFLIDCKLSKNELIESSNPEYKFMLDYIENGEKMGISRTGSLIASRKLWYKQEFREPSYFYCSYMGRGNKEFAPFRVMLNWSRALVLNTYTILYLKPEFSDIMNSKERIEEVHRSLETTFNNAACNARLYAGGLYKIEPREVLDLPFYDIPKWLNELTVD